MALWFPEKCLDRGSLKRLRVPTSLGVSQVRALGWACGPLPSPPPSHSERSQRAGPPCSPADPQPHSFSRAFFRKHLSPHCPPCSPGPGMGSGLDARVSHRKPPLYPVSQGCHPVALEPHLGCHGGIRHRYPFPVGLAGPGLQGTGDGEVSEILSRTRRPLAAAHWSGQTVKLSARHPHPHGPCTRPSGKWIHPTIAAPCPVSWGTPEARRPAQLTKLWGQLALQGHAHYIVQA